MNTNVDGDRSNEYDLESRLLEFAARVIRMTASLEKSVAGKHVANQVLRSGTSPLAHHGEAQGAESRRDFIHKLRIGYKELRETIRWLKLIQLVPLIEKPELMTALITEADELTRIFATSIRTAEKNQ